MLRELNKSYKEDVFSQIAEARAFGHDDDAVKEWARDRFAWLQSKALYLDTKEFNELTERELKELIGDVRISMTPDAIVKDLREDRANGFMRVWDTEYRPDKPLYWSESNHQRFLNKYNIPDIESSRPTVDEDSLIDDFFDCLVPDNEDQYQLLQWIAQACLHPEERNRFALLLFGQSNGTGKGVIQQLLINQMRDYFKPNDSGAWVKNGFHFDACEKTLLILDELYADGKSLNDQMKSLISEDELYVQPKGKNWVKMRNNLNIIATSNSERPLYTDESDRRWFAIHTSLPNPLESKDHQDNAEYTEKVSRFAEWANTARGIQAIRYFLEGIILENWDIRSAPRTDSMTHIIVNSKSIAEEAMDNFVFNNSIVRKTDVFNHDAFKGERIQPARRSELMERAGCKSLETSNPISIGDLGRHRDFWITTKGLELGMDTSMTGRELNKIRVNAEEKTWPFQESSL
ncbi:primase-helicase family protein [Vibrio breoganii]|uniref:primase-helicase family protein n=1 Tax=Vibrio breoganii TaxID=553239 RepID=UPI000C84F503|nr:primase-helicase family protein [Vibrio breoganii]PMO55336.1 hypothetical protein BCT07_15380 [Vibrio breoganii]